MADYGESGYGDGLYGGVGLSETNVETAEDAFEHPLVYLYDESTTRDLLESSLRSSTLIDLSLAAVADAQHLPTAEGGHLDRHGLLVGEQRQALETDAHFRARLRAAGGLARVRPTYDGLDEYVGRLLEATDEDYFLTTDEGGVVQIVASPSTWDDATLDRDEIVDYVQQLIPEGHRAEKDEIEFDSYIRSPYDVDGIESLDSTVLVD